MQIDFLYKQIIKKQKLHITMDNYPEFHNGSVKI